MRQDELREVARRYFTRWYAGDRRHFDVLSGTDESKKLAALDAAAKGYKIARNFHKKYDVDAKPRLERYQPVLEILDSLRREAFEGDKMVAAVNKVERELSRRYGNRGVLSGTSKFLWVKFRSPIIIFDTKVQDALRTRENDYAEYCAVLQREFRLHRSEIQAACGSLTRISGINETPAFVADIASTDWFQVRVFDAYLGKW